MKKFFCIILSTMLIMLCACAQAEAPESSSKAGLTEKDIAVVIGGAKYTINEKAASLIAALGDTTTYDEADSCAYDGLDKYYYYEKEDGTSLTLFTIPLMDGEDTICQIETTDPAVKTAAGIGVGSSLSDVINAYGDNYACPDGSTYYYLLGVSNAAEAENLLVPHIYFVVENDTVTSLSIYSARNNG